MITAYLAILVKPGEESNVADKLTEMPEVKDVDVVYGEYDIIAKIEVKDMESLQKFLVTKIRAIDEIDRTSTMIAIK